MGIMDYFSNNDDKNISLTINDKLSEAQINGIISMEDYLIITTLIKRNCPLNKQYYLKCIDKLDIELANKIKESIHIFKFYQNNQFIVSLFVENYINLLDLPCTDDQKKALNMLTTFLSSDETVFGLYGFAGTGKTSLIMKFVHYLIENNYIISIALSAPTNIAVDILKSKFKDLIINDFDSILQNYEQQNKKITFTTLHKLLGFKRDLDIDGNMLFLQSNATIFNEYGIVIVDECSMITSEIITKILSDVKKLSLNYSVKVIFIGDPAQLPPVNSTNSIVFDNSLFNTITMKQVVRSNDNNVVGLCNEIRKWTMNEIKSPSLKNYKGLKIKYYNNKGVKTDNNWFKKFIECKKNGKNCIILTWTNEQCSIYNSIARSTLHVLNNDIKEYEVGDSLIMNSYYVIGQEKNLYTSEQIVVASVDSSLCSVPEFNININPTISMPNLVAIKEKYKSILQNINKSTNRKYNIWKLGINRMDSKNLYYINVCKKNDSVLLEKEKFIASSKIKELIQYFSTYHKDQFATIINIIIKPLWKEYKVIFINNFANVSYGNSCTTHKAQGANFHDVFIDAPDILSNPNYEESKKCLYTAITRVSNEVHLLI